MTFVRIEYSSSSLIAMANMCTSYRVGIYDQEVAKVGTA